MDGAPTAPLFGTLEAVAGERLRKDILSGILEPNAKLRIRHLCDLYDIGATPLREALSRLVSEGLVQVEENKGFRVTNLSMLEISEVTEMRQVLEGYGFVQSILRGDDHWESEVVAAFHRLKKAITVPLPDSTRQRERWEETHRTFHLSLLSACGNGRFCARSTDCIRHSCAIACYCKLNDLPPKRLVVEHERLLNVVIQRDKDAAAVLMQHHVQFNSRQVANNVRDHPELLGLPG